MPRANQDQAGDTRVPRGIFQHAHIDAQADFPCMISFDTAEMFLLIPDNWNGLSKVFLWLLGGGIENANLLDVVINIGTSGEAFNIHTQAVANNNVVFALNEYIKIDLTAIFAVVLANLQSLDMMWVTATWQNDTFEHFCVGLEVQET